MKTISILLVAVMSISSLVLAKVPVRKIANSREEAATFIDSRRAALQIALQDMTTETQTAVAIKLGLKSASDITSYVQPDGENSNYLNLLKAENALLQVLESRK